MSEHEHSDPLFGGLTRPPTVMGVPIDALLVIIGLPTVIYLFVSISNGNIFWKLFPLGLAAVLFGVARVICRNDPRKFRYIFLRNLTKARHQSKHWGAGSYSPVPYRKRRPS